MSSKDAEDYTGEDKGKTAGVREEIKEIAEGVKEEVKEVAGEMYERIVAFMHRQSAGGICLVAAMVLALVVVNSPLGSFYEAFIAMEGGLRIGTFNVEGSMESWINDFWMVFFFLLVGLEIKAELIDGYLRDRSMLPLPLFGALGGMLVPALIFVAINFRNQEALAGWAIPAATDIAFALGVLSLLGSHVPVGAKVFLMTLAIIDDLGAILIIALFYTSDLNLPALMLTGLTFLVMVLMNRYRVSNLLTYLVLGLLLWAFMHRSGVHATLAGVLTAFCIPWKGLTDPAREPVHQLIDSLNPWVAFAILPLFAFVNTGIDLSSVQPGALLGTLPIGIMVALVLGKQIGVFGFAWLILKTRFARLPKGVRMSHLYGVAALCGIGFTMSLFIGELAFRGAESGNTAASKLAIMIASVISALIGLLIFRTTPDPPKKLAVKDEL